MRRRLHQQHQVHGMVSNELQDMSSMSANAVKMGENYIPKHLTQPENAVVPINKNRSIREKTRRQNARIKIVK